MRVVSVFVGLLVRGVFHYPDGLPDWFGPKTVADCSTPDCYRELKQYFLREADCNAVTPDRTQYLNVTDAAMIDESCAHFVEFFSRLFDLGVRMAESDAYAADVRVLEEEIWTEWQFFIDSLHRTLSRQTFEDGPNWGNATREIIRRHSRELITVISRLSNADPVSVLTAAEHTFDRIELLIENLSMSAILNYFIAALQFNEARAAQGGEDSLLLKHYGPLDDVKTIFHDISGKRWDVLAHLFGTLPQERHDRGLTFAEVGVENGNTSARILQAVPSITQHVGVDPYMNNDGQLIATTAKLAAIGKTTLIRNTSMEAAGLFPAESFDLVFLDARHDYYAVVEDVLAWSSRVKPGGILAGHDWSWMFPPVAMAIFRLASNMLPREIHISVDGVWWWEF